QGKKHGTSKRRWGSGALTMIGIGVGLATFFGDSVANAAVNAFGSALHHVGLSGPAVGLGMGLATLAMAAGKKAVQSRQGGVGASQLGEPIPPGVEEIGERMRRIELYIDQVLPDGPRRGQKGPHRSLLTELRNQRAHSNPKIFEAVIRGFEQTLQQGL